MTQDFLTIVTTLTFYAIVVISPGPNFALVTKLSVSGSQSAALTAVLGMGIASTLYAISL